MADQRSPNGPFELGEPQQRADDLTLVDPDAGLQAEPEDQSVDVRGFLGIDADGESDGGVCARACALPCGPPLPWGWLGRWGFLFRGVVTS